MHLTNYAINKYDEGFKQPEEGGTNESHKLSLKTAFEILSSEGISTENVWWKIKDIVAKTLCSV